MQPYHSVSKTTGQPSGVEGFDYGKDYITVYFTSGEWYTYNYGSCGINHIETMKLLAQRQSGLNTYIARHQPDYASKR